MSATAAEPVLPEAQGGIFSISGRQWLILLMVQLSNLLFGMTITIANVVLPQVRGSLSATQDEIAWVITFNLVATAIATPMTGLVMDMIRNIASVDIGFLLSMSITPWASRWAMRP